MARAGNGMGGPARLVLLLATLLGLTAMHTLGHAGPHSLGDHRHPMDRIATAPFAVDLVAGIATDCAGDGCDHLLAGSGQDLAGMGDWAVCLAILVAFAVIALAAVLHYGRRAGRAPADCRLGRRMAPRGPPRRPLGLTLVTVSVLRT